MVFSGGVHRLAFVASVIAFGGVTPTVHAGTELYLDGYFRARGRLYDNLALNRSAPLTDPGTTDTASSDGTTALIQQRLRVEPELRVNQYVSVFGEVDVLPNLIWGTGAELGDYSSDYYLPVGLSQAFESPTGSAMLDVRRLWAEFYTPVGRVKLGRTAMKVGAGVFFNDGNAMDADYGDTVDRAQFLTRIGPIYALAGYDMLHEGDLDRPYDAQAASAAIAYRSELISGSLYSHVVIDRSRLDEGELTTSTAGDALPDQVSLTVGTFDLWGQAHIGPVDLEMEALLRYGTGDLVLQSQTTDAVEVVEDATILSYGGMARAHMKKGALKLGLEAGLASGDSTPDDKSLGTFTFDPDYHLGFLLFRTPMPARASVSTDTSLTDVYDTARVGNAVSNAFYLMPSVEMKLFDNLSARVGGVAAWAMVSEEGWNGATDYGYEVNLGLSSTLVERVHLSGTAALMFPGAIFDEPREFAFGAELQAGIEF